MEEISLRGVQRGPGRPHEYEQHLRSKSHKRAVSRAKRVAGDRKGQGPSKRPKVAASSAENAKDEATDG